MNRTALATIAPSRVEPGARELRAIGGVGVAAVSRDEAVRVVCERLDAGIFTRIAFLNAHCVNLAYARPDYRASLADFMVLPDGVGIDLAARMLFGKAFPENLNGTDFVPFLLGRIERPLRVALIGAQEGVATRAAAKFAELAPRHTFLAVSNGYFREGPETEAVLAKLRAAKPDIVLVALGVPRQELFISHHLTGEEATVAIAVGALLDFMAGKVPRAPHPVRALRLEWVYRLALEPRRLWKRYILGNPRFLLHVIRETRARARAR